MEKKSKHISPMQSIAAIFLLSGYSIIYYTNLLVAELDNDRINPVTIIIAIIGFVLVFTSIVLNIKFLANKKNRYGDEFTTKIIQKAAYYCFMLIMFLISMLFISLHMITPNKNFQGSLNDLFDIKVILGLIAAFQTICAFLFILLLSIFSKKGETNETNKKSEDLI